MARIKCIMMQRDETQLLLPWLRHHGALFGFENLIVLDNGSRDTGVLATLACFERAGVRVERAHAQPQDFLDKGRHVARVIAGLDAASGPEDGYDFALPIDCDEFLAVFDEFGLSCSRRAIDRAFDALLGERRALAIEMSLTNVVGRPGWFAADTLQKGFLPAGSVQEVDHGFHHLRSRLEDGMRWTRFCFLHFHNKPFETLVAHARRKLDGLVDHHDLDALRRYRGMNYHLVPYFFMTEAQYRSIPDRMLTLTAPGFIDLAAALGTDRMLFGGPATETDGTVRLRLPGEAPVAFEGTAYLAAHPDVQAAAVAPLQHYLRHGWSEGRRLSRSDRPET